MTFRLQQMCILMAHSIERVVISNFQEETAFDARLVTDCLLVVQTRLSQFYVYLTFDFVFLLAFKNVV